MSYRIELDVACRAVQTAAVVCQSVQAQIAPEVLSKQDRSPVTVADFASQAIICRELRAAFSSDPIIAEEDSAALKTPETAPFLEQIGRELSAIGLSADGDEICQWIDQGQCDQFSGRFWTLDPIDGTKGFLRGGQYALSLALIVEGRIEVAILGCPNLPLSAGSAGPCGILFFAVRGEGSCCIPLDVSPETTPKPSSVCVSKTADSSEARLCESVESGHSAHGRSATTAERLGITARPIRLDSQAKYATVARGEADIYLRLPTRADYNEKIWDHAGGVLIVEEAGGTVTDMTGKPLEFTHGHELTANRGVVVTNGLLHKTVLTALG